MRPALNTCLFSQCPGLLWNIATRLAARILKISLALRDVVMVRAVLAAAVLPNRQPALNLESLESKDIPISGFGGGSGDRPSLVECAEISALLSRQQAGAVGPRGDPNFITPPEVLLLALPGQCHTFALDWKHFSRRVLGEHVGLAD